MYVVSNAGVYELLRHGNSDIMIKYAVMLNDARIPAVFVFVLKTAVYSHGKC